MKTTITKKGRVWHWAVKDGRTLIDGGYVRTKKDAAHDAAIVKGWHDIPHMPLGEVPDDMPDETPILYRRIIAKRAIIAGYEAEEDPEACIADLLADLRHLCDAINLDFHTLDKRAYGHYIAERPVKTLRRKRKTQHA